MRIERMCQANLAVRKLGKVAVPKADDAGHAVPAEGASTARHTGLICLAELGDFQVHDLFVPEEHARPAFAAKPIQPGTLYATPMITIFAASIPCVRFGMHRAAIDAFVELAEAKTPMGSIWATWPKRLRNAPGWSPGPRSCAY